MSSSGEGLSVPSQAVNPAMAQHNNGTALSGRSSSETNVPPSRDIGTSYLLVEMWTKFERGYALGCA
jgi:hypothetical protein